MDPGTGACLIVNRDSAEVTIIFATHATSLDNERGLASGWYDADLSPRGIEQAQELGARYAEERFDAVFCSAAAGGSHSGDRFRRPRQSHHSEPALARV
jgi:hypothetical protein